MKTSYKAIADKIVKYSVKLKPNEVVFLEYDTQNADFFVCDIVEIVTARGGIPIIFFNNPAHKKKIIENASVSQIKKYADFYNNVMKTCDVYIGVRGRDNIGEFSNIAMKKMACFLKYYERPIYIETKANKKWCSIIFPSKEYADLSGMSFKEYEKLFLKTTLFDYNKLKPLAKKIELLLNKTNMVHIVSKDGKTDLTFSIKGIKSFACIGEYNLPDGEVFTAPIKTSVNGKVQFHSTVIHPATHTKFKNIYLEFKRGKIIKASSEINNEMLQKIIKTDKGASYLGEFALGLNPHVTKIMNDAAFDEKILGSFHIAIGNCYKQKTDNGNYSSIHWDLVQIYNDDYPGEIYFDNKLIQKNGCFCF